LGAEDAAWLTPGKDDKSKRRKIWQYNGCEKILNRFLTAPVWNYMGKNTLSE